MLSSRVGGRKQIEGPADHSSPLASGEGEMGDIKGGKETKLLSIGCTRDQKKEQEQKTKHPAADRPGRPPATS